jgi:ribosome-binding protein aMBF1 (putative translation factor)
MANIGKCVRVAQEVRDISSQKLAADFKTTKQQVWRWRNAEDMKVSKVEELAQYFKLTRNDFLDLGDM